MPSPHRHSAEEFPVLLVPLTERVSAGWEEDGARGEPCKAMLTDKGRRRIVLWILRDVQGLFTRKGRGLREWLLTFSELYCTRM